VSELLLRGFLLSLVLLAFDAQAADILIRNANIVDVKTGEVLARRSILIHGDRIQSIAPSIQPTHNAQIVDARGKYVIPGLWDMHVHLWYKQNQFPMFLAWGVTGVRDMGSNLDQVKRWRAEIKSGDLLGPHIETCGPPVDGTPSDDPKLPITLVRTPAEARTAYDHLEQDLNVDFIKILSHLPRDAYFALIERARKWGLPVAGHVPDSVTVDEAITARQNSMEHLMGVLLSCSSEEQKIRPLRALAMEQKDGKALAGYAERVLVTFDPTKASTLFERMARYSSYQVPTLVMWRRNTYADADDVVHDPRLRFIPAAIRKDWDDPREIKKNIPESTMGLVSHQYERLAWVVAQMQRQGVPIMAGTDTGDPYTFPGYDLHRELQLLVKAGLTPAQALRSATLTPAEYLDSDESLGSVGQGKMADLVFLDADPLKDIRNTQRISAVILGGKYLSRAKLDSMLLRGRQ
jgi:imidazolonepropionase-like amidohydrolase